MYYFSYPIIIICIYMYIYIYIYIYILPQIFITNKILKLSFPKGGSFDTNARSVSISLIFIVSFEKKNTLFDTDLILIQYWFLYTIFRSFLTNWNEKTLLFSVAFPHSFSLSFLSRVRLLYQILSYAFYYLKKIFLWERFLWRFHAYYCRTSSFFNNNLWFFLNYITFSVMVDISIDLRIYIFSNEFECLLTCICSL